jgi:hypothetical protein
VLNGEARGLPERRLEAEPVAVFATHRTLGAPDVIQSFLRTLVNGAPAKVFACTVASQERLESDLAAAAFVVEDLSVQFASTARLTNASLEAALQSWCERLLPNRPAPRIVLDPWAGDLSQPDPQLLDLLLRRRDAALASAPSDAENPRAQARGFEPPPNLADNSCPGTAA